MGDPGRPKLDEATRAALLGQFAVEQLLLGLALVEGFMLDVVVVPTARVALSVRWLLEEELPERRADALEIRVLAPDPARASAFAPVEAEELLERVLAPLMAPPAAKPGVLTLTWIDAATARPEDEPAWTTLFHRFNERRNAITEGLKGPLLVVLPPRMEAVFAHAAPDAWSVRSGVHRVKLADLETHAIDVDPERRPSLVEGASRGGPRYLTLALALESDEPAHFDDAKRSWVFSQGVSQLLARGALDEAERVAQTAVEGARAAAAQAPASAEAANSLLRALSAASEVAEALGDDEEGRRIDRERAELATSQIELGHTSVEWLRARSAALAALAHRTVGPAGLELAREAVAQARETLHAYPQHPLTKLDLAQVLATYGEALQHEGSLGAAATALDEAVALLGDVRGLTNGLASGFPTGAITVFGIRARVRVLLGQFSEARADAQLGLQLATWLKGKIPNHFAARQQALAAALELGRVEWHMGDLARADQVLELARREAASLMHAWPQSSRAVLLRAEALCLSCEFASSGGDFSHVTSWRRELDQLRAGLIKRIPNEPDLLELSRRLVALGWATPPPDP